MIDFILLSNKFGQTRLSHYYNKKNLSSSERVIKEADYVRMCLSRNPGNCCFFETNGQKIIFRRYASLFFIIGYDDEEENELALFSFIHCIVEAFDKYFENVCELDIMYNLEKAHSIINEMVSNGQIVATNKVSTIYQMKLLDSCD